MIEKPTNDIQSNLTPEAGGTGPQAKAPQHHDHHHPFGIGFIALGLVALFAGLLSIIFIANITESALIIMGGIGFALIIIGLIIDIVYRMNQHKKPPTQLR